MNRTEKTFDSVQMMRSARDRISREIQGMTLEEELAWIASQAMDDAFLKRLRDRLPSGPGRGNSLRPADDRPSVGWSGCDR